jgi:hypothetical protein
VNKYICWVVIIMLGLGQKAVIFTSSLAALCIYDFFRVLRGSRKN